MPAVVPVVAVGGAQWRFAAVSRGLRVIAEMPHRRSTGLAREVSAGARGGRRNAFSAEELGEADPGDFEKPRSLNPEPPGVAFPEVS